MTETKPLHTLSTWHLWLWIYPTGLCHCSPVVVLSSSELPVWLGIFVLHAPLAVAMEKRKHVLFHRGSSWGSSDASGEAERERKHRDTVFKDSSTNMQQGCSRAGGPSLLPKMRTSLRAEKLLGGLLGMRPGTSGCAVVPSSGLFIQTHLLTLLDWLWNILLLWESALVFFHDLMVKFSGKLALTLGLGTEKQRMLSQQQCNKRISIKKCWRKEL